MQNGDGSLLTDLSTESVDICHRSAIFLPRSKVYRGFLELIGKAAAGLSGTACDAPSARPTLDGV
jgi:hypothetical protein